MQLMTYMAEEFLKMRASVVFDMNAMRFSQRRMLREMARKLKSVSILIWFQIDTENSFARLQTRDRRKNDDKYARVLDWSTFNDQLGAMQNPSSEEEYIVLSGKHTFNSQRNAVIRKLHDLKLIDMDSAQSNLVKPGLVNLVPSTKNGRVDETRRNIVIR